jgi:hypothetical protein
LIVGQRIERRTVFIWRHSHSPHTISVVACRGMARLAMEIQKGASV